MTGDVEAFRPLVERYERLLYVVALRMLDDREDAVDAAQNVFLKAFEKLTSYDGRHKFFSWLYRILVNECLNVRRSRRPRSDLTPDLAGTGNPADDVLRNETRRRVRAAVAHLPPALREVIVLRHFGELSYEEIADTLNLPEKTVKSRLYEARRELGRQLLGWKDAR